MPQGRCNFLPEALRLQCVRTCRQCGEITSSIQVHISHAMISQVAASIVLSKTNGSIEREQNSLAKWRTTIGALACFVHAKPCFKDFARTCGPVSNLVPLCGVRYNARTYPAIQGLTVLGSMLMKSGVAPILIVSGTTLTG